SNSVNLRLIHFEREVVFSLRVFRLFDGDESLSRFQHHLHQYEASPRAHLSPFLMIHIVEFEGNKPLVDRTQPVDILD
ncbi:hypothetical protein PENTCL1PPCAC_3206, partial [Pristionchus entomophagus]